jgi:hypothetical protein
MDGLGSTTALETEPDGHTCEQTQVQLDELLAEREKINTRIQEILDSRGNQPRDIFPNNHVCLLACLAIILFRIVQ